MSDIIKFCMILKAKKENLDRVEEARKAANREYESAIAELCNATRSLEMGLNPAQAWPFARILLSALQELPPNGLEMSLEEMVDK